MHYPTFRRTAYNEHSHAEAGAVRPRIQAHRGRAPRVLVVEGEALLSDSLAQILAADFTVTAVASASDALELLESGATYDVVLCDLALPQMDGAELLDRVRSFAPDMAGRFVFVTSGGDRADATDALAPRPSLAERPIDIRALRGVAEWHFSHSSG